MISAHDRRTFLAGVMGAALFSACTHLPSPLETLACDKPAACVQEDLDALATARLSGDHDAWVKASIRAYRRSPDLTLPVIYGLTPNDGDLGEKDLLALTRALLGRIDDRSAGHQARRMVRNTLKTRYNTDLPDLAVRDGKWKFLCEFDGSEPELYDISNDRGEKTNVAGKHPKLVARLAKACIAWHKSMPPDNGPQLVGNARRNTPKKPKKN